MRLVVLSSIWFCFLESFLSEEDGTAHGCIWWLYMIVLFSRLTVYQRGGGYCSWLYLVVLSDGFIFQAHSVLVRRSARLVIVFGGFIWWWYFPGSQCISGENCAARGCI